MERIQNKVAWALVVALSLLVIAALAGVVRGGPLDPTAPPGSTGKNVITSLPFTISQPGSYVLNGNLTGVSGSNGITVNAANVTIDLQGFELVGVSGALRGVNATQPNLTVRNGTVRNWPEHGVSALAGSAVDDLRVSGTGFGIVLGDQAAVTNCLVEGSTGGQGIQVGSGSAVSNCRSFSNAGQGISAGADVTITDTIARANGGAEIVAGARAVLENCVADGALTAGRGIQVHSNSIVRGCTAVNNGDVGILATTAATLESCNASGNTGDGIQAGANSIVRTCTATNNGTLANHSEITVGDRSIIEDCVADGWNGSTDGPGAGILVNNNTVVRNCTVQNNGLPGIFVTGNDNHIVGNHAVANSVAGIHIYETSNFNRIEANHVSRNDTKGIRVDSVFNVGLMNTAFQNGGHASNNYQINLLSSSNHFPIVATATDTTMGAWANFSQ